MEIFELLFTFLFTKPKLPNALYAWSPRRFYPGKYEHQMANNKWQPKTQSPDGEHKRSSSPPREKRARSHNDAITLTSSSSLAPSSSFGDIKTQKLQKISQQVEKMKTLLDHQIHAKVTNRRTFHEVMNDRDMREFLNLFNDLAILTL